MKLKTCSACGLEQDLNNFHKNKSCKGGHRTHCRQCVAISVKNWRATGSTVVSSDSGKSFKALSNKVSEINKLLVKFNYTVKMEKITPAGFK
jgi:superfamily II helicase